MTVCIVTYKRDEKLIECLGKLAQSTLQPSQVLIVDNGRSAGLPSRLAKVPLPIELIYPEGNVGCAGLNLAFRKAKAPIVICLDDDSYPAPECIEGAVGVFMKDETVGMVGFNMHAPDSGEPWGDELWSPVTAEPLENVYCAGCGLAFRNDPRLPEELCLKTIVSQQHELSMAAEILRLGYRIEFRPECVAYHPRTGGKDNFGPEKFEMLKRNQMIFLGTFLPPMSRCTILMSYLLFIFGNRHWPARHALGGFLAARPRPLPRQLAARFVETAMLHTHPWLRGLMMKTLGLPHRRLRQGPRG